MLNLGLGSRVKIGVAGFVGHLVKPLDFRVLRGMLGAHPPLSS